MKILITTDNEGVCGVSRSEDTESPATRKQLVAEVNATIEGILRAAPSAEMVVIDGHGGGSLGCNISREDLNHAARLLDGRRGTEIPSAVLVEHFDALFCVGVHAMAGTPQGNLNHTISSDHFYNVQLNGVAVGEAGLLAAIAGEKNIPLAFLTGDFWACQEITALLPHVQTVAVKKGLNRFCAMHEAPDKVGKLIRDGAAHTITHLSKAVPYHTKHPVELAVDYLYSNQADHAVLRGAKRTGNRSVLITADSVADALSKM